MAGTKSCRDLPWKWTNGVGWVESPGSRELWLASVTRVDSCTHNYFLSFDFFNEPPAGVRENMGWMVGERTERQGWVGGGERTRRKNPRPHREGKYREVPRDVWRKEKRRRFCETEEANETRSAAKRRKPLTFSFLSLFRFPRTEDPFFRSYSS